MARHRVTLLGTNERGLLLCAALRRQRAARPEATARGELVRCRHDARDRLQALAGLREAGDLEPLVRDLLDRLPDTRIDPAPLDFPPLDSPPARETYGILAPLAPYRVESSGRDRA